VIYDRKAFAATPWRCPSSPPGKLFLMGPEVAERAQSHAAFRFLFNGLQYGPAAARARRGRDFARPRIGGGHF
jgi:hypothetical protein